MQHIQTPWRRKLISLFCALLIFCSVLSPVAFADNATVTSGSMYSYFQTFSSGGQWVDVMTPSHWITETGEVAYCLQTSKDSPYNSGYHSVDGSDLYSQYVLNGLYAILQNGYPVTTGGYSDEEARYATANAIRFWMAENGCEGMPSYLSLKINGDWIRGKYGYEGLFNWAVSLVQLARDQAVSTGCSGSISFSPSSLALVEDDSGAYFTGTATVSKSISGSYGIYHNLPTGSEVTGYTGENGDRLTIRVPVDYGEQSFSITAYGNHDGNTAKLFFWAPDAYNQQRVVTYVLDTNSQYVEGYLPITTPKATPKNGHISIQKLDEETGEALPGVTFALYDSGKNQLATGVTDASGVVTFSDRPIGTYYYSEIEGLPAYVLDTTLYPVSITESGQTVTVTATNRLARGSVAVHKISTRTGEALPGVHFVLKDAAGTLVGEGDTGADGMLRFDNLLLGDYTLQETATVSDHVLDPTVIPVTVSSDGQVVTVERENEPVRGSIQVLKTSTLTGQALPGVHFVLYDIARNVVAEGDSGADGTLTFQDILYGDYILKETATVIDHVLDETEIPVSITEDGQTIEISRENDPIRGSLKIVKKVGHEEQPLPGAGFRVLAEDGSIVAEGVTDQNGELLFEDLLYDTGYSYQEVSVPKGFVLDQNVYPLSITENNVTVTREHENFRREATLQVLKQDHQGNPLSGTTFLLEYSSDNGNTWSPVSYREAGTNVSFGGCTSAGLNYGQLTTGADGLAVFTGLRAGGEILYRLTETACPPGYSLMGDPLYVGTLPVAVNDPNIADGETVDGTTYTYSLYVTATDNPVFRLPEAGGNGFSLLPFALLLLAAPLFAIKLKKESLHE